MPMNIKICVDHKNNLVSSNEAIPKSYVIMLSDEARKDSERRAKSWPEFITLSAIIHKILVFLVCVYVCVCVFNLSECSQDSQTLSTRNREQLIAAWFLVTLNS